MNKIIIINQYGVTPDQPGASKHYEMAQYFATKGEYSVEFWMCGYNHHTGKNHKKLKGIKLEDVEKIDNLKLIRLKGIPYKSSNVMRQINHSLFDIIVFFKLLFLCKRTKVILSVPPLSLFTSLAMKIKRIRYIVDVEDLWPLFLIEMGLNNTIAIKIMNLFAWYTYTNASAIAPVSSGMMLYLKKSGFSQKMWVAPLGVNLNEYANTQRNEALIVEKDWAHKFKIMYIGAHGRANDLYSVLDTIKIIENRMGICPDNRQIAFVFLGDGNEKEKILSYAKDLNLSTVYFEDPIPNIMVKDYLVHADICLTNLMKIESFKLVRPNKLFQYMALGKPIICGIWGESAEIVTETAQSGIYVDFTENEQAANSILEMVGDNVSLSIYKENGPRYISKYGDRALIFDEYYKQVKEL